jgi:hypothetical protein
MKQPRRFAKALLRISIPSGIFRDSALGDLEEGIGRVRCSVRAQNTAQARAKLSATSPR